jgi:hypothetical protein
MRKALGTLVVAAAVIVLAKGDPNAVVDTAVNTTTGVLHWLVTFGDKLGAAIVARASGG